MDNDYSCAGHHFSSASMDAQSTRTLLFHHYVYGFAVLALACAYVIIFTPASLVTLFWLDQQYTCKYWRSLF
jgi:hypothetical protein